MNTRELLDQDQLWLSADRMPIRLEEMDSGHRRNTLAFLRRRAAQLAQAYVWCEFKLFSGAPDDVFNDWLSEHDGVIYDDPPAWLEQRPLVRELARLVALDEQVETRGDPAGRSTESRESLDESFAAQLERGLRDWRDERRRGRSEKCPS